MWVLIGFGFPDLAVKMCVTRHNTLMQHYAIDTRIGVTLQTSLELLQLEIDMVHCPIFMILRSWAI